MVTRDHAAGVTDTCDGTYRVGGKGSVIEILPHLKKSLLQIIGLKQNCKTFTKRERDMLFHISRFSYIYIFFVFHIFTRKAQIRYFAGNICSIICNCESYVFDLLYNSVSHQLRGNLKIKRRKGNSFTFGQSSFTL